MILMSRCQMSNRKVLSWHETCNFEPLRVSDIIKQIAVSIGDIVISLFVILTDWTDIEPIYYLLQLAHSSWI